MEFRIEDAEGFGGNGIVAWVVNGQRKQGHTDEGGAKFLRNVGSYKSHTA
jgi:hypothetical protein